MATSVEYFEFIKEQLSDVQEASYRPMMGEYIIYFEGKVVGGLYDDRLLVKPTKNARELLPTAPLVSPYEGGKDMLLVEDVEDRDLLKMLFAAVAVDLPNGKKKK